MKDINKKIKGRKEGSDISNSDLNEKIKGIINGTSISGLGIIIPFIESLKNQLYNENKNIIDNYNSITDMLILMEERVKKIQYTLHISKDRGYGEFACAKVKFGKFNEETKKYPFYNVHIAKISYYKKGLEDEQLKIDAEKKIKDFVNKKFPLIIKTLDGFNIEIPNK
jgi:hypothetical protein